MAVALGATLVLARPGERTRSNLTAFAPASVAGTKAEDNIRVSNATVVKTAVLILRLWFWIAFFMGILQSLRQYQLSLVRLIVEPAVVCPGLTSAGLHAGSTESPA